MKIRGNQIFACWHLLTISPNWPSISLNFTSKVLRSPHILTKMSSLYQNINQEAVHEQESAVEGIHSRWNSSSQVIVDRLPSQPLSRREFRREAATGGLQGSNSNWTYDSGVIVDSLPSLPVSCRRSAVGELLQGSSRWSSGSLAAFDTGSSRALIRHLE
jgi:hypothetical protein